MSSPGDSRSHLWLVPPDGGRRVVRTAGEVGGLQYEAGLGVSELSRPDEPAPTPAAMPRTTSDRPTNGEDRR